jgi:DNA-binding GntR family transcriptional regulator
MTTPRITSPRATPPTMSARSLDRDDPAPVLRVQHTVWDAADQPMTLEVNIVPANRWATYDYPVVAPAD